VLVYFGYPQAHEDDAERAVRAGLELIAPVAALKTRTPLQTRVGISTGMVVVGDLIGSGSAQEQAVVGETPNLAARFESLEVLMACLRVDGRLSESWRSSSEHRPRAQYSGWPLSPLSVQLRLIRSRDFLLSRRRAFYRDA
jgi:Adenylate and Guanylate cyclase catalytic domain